MSNEPSQNLRIDADRLFQVMSRYAGRVAKTDDPKAHQEAARQMQIELGKTKIKSG